MTITIALLPFFIMRSKNILLFLGMHCVLYNTFMTHHNQISAYYAENELEYKCKILERGRGKREGGGIKFPNFTL